MRKLFAAGAVVILLGLGAGAGIAATAGTAGAGIGPQGYAQIAQRALQKAGGFYGYRVVCTGRYSNYATAQVRVTCTMTEQP